MLYTKRTPIEREFYPVTQNFYGQEGFLTYSSYFPKKRSKSDTIPKSVKKFPVRLNTNSFIHNNSYLPYRLIFLLDPSQTSYNASPMPKVAQRCFRYQRAHSLLRLLLQNLALHFWIYSAP